jgi:hypothetical protein
MLTPLPVAVLDAPGLSQERQAHGAPGQLEALTAYSQPHAYWASPYESTYPPGPGFGPNVGLRAVDQSAQLDANVNSFSSACPQDPPSNSGQVRLQTNSSVALATNTASTSVPRRRARRKRFECEDCHKTFDRINRVDNCRNRHLGIKPWQCAGRCHDPTWFVIPTSYLRRFTFDWT